MQVNENSSLRQLLTNDTNLEILRAIGFRGNPFKATHFRSHFLILIQKKNSCVRELIQKLQCKSRSC